MPRFLYASPILPGKTELVRQVYAQKREHPEFEKNAPSFNALIGLDSWQSWLQCTPNRDYFIHAIETRDLEEMFSKLQDQIQAGHSQAQWIRDFYLDVFGKDYSHSSAVPEIEPLIQLDIPMPEIEQGDIYSRGFVYPLRPNKVQDHREFSRQAQGEYRMRIEDACRQFQITKTNRFLHKTPHQDYVVIYQEYVPFTPEQELQAQKIRKTNPSWLWLSDILMAHTGLTIDQLEPKVEPLTRQPIATINAWRNPVAAMMS